MGRSQATYRVPDVLRPIQILDFVELAGSTLAAAEALHLSQPTVSRHSRRLIHDLGLVSSTGNRDPGALRHGSSACLQLLRQAAQHHRLMAGAWRLGSCPWVEAVLPAFNTVVRNPVQLRHDMSWRILLQAHVLDLVLISGFDLELICPEPLPSDPPITVWGAFALLPVGSSAMGLLCPPTQPDVLHRWSPIAVPTDSLAPGLGAMVRQTQWRCRYAPKSCHAAGSWAKWLEDVQVPVAATAAWAAQLERALNSWYWRPWPKPVQDQVWLVALETVWRSHPQLEELRNQLSGQQQEFDADSESASRKSRGN
ncbi:hypothetical protein [Synechococcus sp. A15-44]|uniref:hypothetical protein n=1 Tax=Synechococcus sp. A15-44 TaxID=1050646 RepID=UPI0016453AF3|nr:hypothetical protein [Synechococcus sp. A15-44]